MLPLNVLRTYLLVFFLGFVACGRPSTSLIESAEKSSCQGMELERAISTCLKKVTLLSVEQQTSGMLRYDLTITQPVDHHNLDLGEFEQRLVLFHKGYDRPMILATTGYGLYSTRESEPAKLLAGNQLLVEHRYFDLSSPSEMDWSYMNVEQSAADFHAVTEEFKKLYTARWLNTGASKGGMTSVYHRFHYPDDLDGTIAYVAPLSFSAADLRYNDFLTKVGGESYAECRSKLLDFRREILKRKNIFAKKINEAEFRRYGGPVQAIEVAAAEFHFVFWQYQRPAMCQNIPNAKSSDGTVFNFFTSVSSFYSSYADEGVDYFAPYFFQAATELGAPAWDLEGIEDLMDYPESLKFEKITPAGVPLVYNGETMQLVDEWVQNESAKIMFIYGEFDPWSAASFRLGSSSERDSHLFVVPSGNHGASMSALSQEDRKAAYSILGAWAGVDLDQRDIDEHSFTKNRDYKLDPREFLRP